VTTGLGYYNRKIKMLIYKIKSNNENTNNSNNGIVIMIVIYIDNIFIIINILTDAIQEILCHDISLYFSPTINFSHETPLIKRKITIQRILRTHDF
jgi:hypothetical protein